MLNEQDLIVQATFQMQMQNQNDEEDGEMDGRYDLRERNSHQFLSPLVSHPQSDNAGQHDNNEEMSKWKLKKNQQNGQQ